ncbi:MAG: tRNA pseudouridine(55) synthase TruB [Arcobacteraceae bacterium]
MKKKLRNDPLFNKLLVVQKPMYMGSNFFLHQVKKKYNSKKAGFSGTLDPFATGCLIVAFGQFAKLFNYLNKSPKTYRAVLWLGAVSDSLDIENITHIGSEKVLNEHTIKEEILNLMGEINYVPPKFSAKRINGIRAYELARNGEEIVLKESTMHILETKFISYSHPFITFEATVSEGSYIRSLAQILAQRLGVIGTLSHLHRVREGDFFYENEKELNPLDYIGLPRNEYTGDKEWVFFGKKIDSYYLSNRDDGEYLILFDDFFSIIQITNKDVKYLLNKVLLNENE